MKDTNIPVPSLQQPFKYFRIYKRTSPTPLFYLFIYLFIYLLITILFPLQDACLSHACSPNGAVPPPKVQISPSMFPKIHTYIIYIITTNYIKY